MYATIQDNLREEKMEADRMSQHIKELAQQLHNNVSPWSITRTVIVVDVVLCSGKGVGLVILLENQPVRIPVVSLSKKLFSLCSVLIISRDYHILEHDLL